MQYAFDEFRNMVSKILSPNSDKDAIVRYTCALISELTYHHVPQFEIDNKKRTKIIPCQGYRDIVTKGVETSVLTYLRELELGRSFIVVDRGVIAVGIELDRLLFIGFRGTKFQYDWRINLSTRLTPIGGIWNMHRPWEFIGFNGKFHSGFANESFRISMKILDKVKAIPINNIEHVYLTGHSLGGAVAAISGNILTIGPSSTYIMGSPRYCNTSAYFNMHSVLPTQIRRHGDVVPFVPPRCIGYADHPYEFGTSGNAIFDLKKDRSLSLLLWKWGLFVSKLAKQHSMEIYRNELGITANAVGANKTLVPYEKLRSIHIGK